MIRKLTLVLFMATLAGQSHAQGTPGTSFTTEDLRDPAVQASLNALPPIKNDRIRGAVVSYDRAAKAWWIQMRCHLADDTEAKRFPDGLADFTQVMRGLFGGEFSATPEDAGKYAEYVQMYALNEMSAARFFGCGEQAKAVFRRGYDETERLSAFLKTIAPAPK